MRTDEEWYQRFDGAVSMDVIKSIQDDSRAGMIEVGELDPVIEFLEFTRKRMMEYGLTVLEIDGHIDRLKALRNEH